VLGTQCPGDVTSKGRKYRERIVLGKKISRTVRHGTDIRRVSDNAEGVSAGLMTPDETISA
jgi:hypothetical protein